MTIQGRVISTGAGGGGQALIGMSGIFASIAQSGRINSHSGQTVRTNNNPDEGLKRYTAVGLCKIGGVRTNNNPDEGLKQQHSREYTGFSSSEQTTTQTRD